MRIKSLHGSNIEGKTFMHKLAPVTLFYGDNFAGKTARLNALTLALCGYLPGVARKPHELFERLATGNPMSVQADSDDCRRFNCVLQEINGSVKLTGDQGTFPPIALDPNEYLGLSGPAQTRYLFGCAKLDNCTVENLTKTVVASVKNIKLEENTKESEAVIGELVTGIKVVGTRQTEPQQFLAQLAEELRVSKNAAVATVDRLAKTGQGLAQVGSSVPAPQDAEARLTKLRTDKEATDAECTKLKTQLEDLRERYKEARDKAQAGSRTNVETLRVEREEAERKIALWASQTPKRPKGAKLWTPEEWYLHREELNEPWQAAKATLESLGSDVRRLGAELEETKGAEVCSKCGQSLAKLKTKAVARIKKELEATERLLKAQAKVTDEKEQAWRKADKNRDAAAEREREEDERHTAISAARVLVSGIDIQLATVANTEAFAQEASKLLKEGEALALRHSDALKRQADFLPKLEAANANYKALVAQRAEAGSKAKAAAEGRKVKVEAEVLKAACKIVAELQEELTNVAVGPLVEAMNRIAGPILHDKVAFKDGELIAVNSAGFHYSHRTWSGTQKLLGYAALSLALASKSPAKIVVLDEVGRLHPRRKVTLYKHLIDLCKAGEIDQAILVDVNVAPTSALQDTEWFKAIEVV